MSVIRRRKPPRATRKPAPETFGDWLAEIAGINKFLNKSPGNLSPEAADWLQRTKTYYRERLVFLSENPPKGVPEQTAKVIAAVNAQCVFDA